jgi:hypothetical protein
MTSVSLDIDGVFFFFLLTTRIKILIDVWQILKITVVD